MTLERGFHWGTDSLVSLVPRVARRVAKKHRGAVLQVANLSRKGGGDIPQSVTHNSGRDADLLFYARDAAGKPVQVTEFLRYDKRGRAGDLRFDVPRNWALVRACVSDKKAVVQSMLVARHLRGMMLRHARRTRAPRWVIARAERVLRQPRRARPHDDHFHLRIYCGKEERLAGCLNSGPVHAWADTFDAEVAALASELAKSLKDGSQKVAVGAAKHLGRLRAEAQADALRAALFDRRAPVRRAALAALKAMWQLDASIPTLVRAATKATEPVWRHKLVALLVDRRAPEAEPLLNTLIAASGLGPKTLADAVRGLGYLGSRAALPAAFPLLAHPRRAVRDAAETALRRITGHTRGTGATAVSGWRAWWTKHHRAKRIAWLRTALEERLRVTIDARRCTKAIGKMLPLIKRGGVGSENARALIRGLTGYSTRPRRARRARSLHRAYRRWYRRGGARKCKKSRALASSAPKRASRR